MMCTLTNSKLKRCPPMLSPVVHNHLFSCTDAEREVVGSTVVSKQGVQEVVGGDRAHSPVVQS